MQQIGCAERTEDARNSHFEKIDEFFKDRNKVCGDGFTKETIPIVNVTVELMKEFAYWLTNY